MIRSRISASQKPPARRPPPARRHPRWRDETKRRFIAPLAAGLIVLLLPCLASAQYYDQGAAPAALKWNQLDTPQGRIIFPQGYEWGALEVRRYLDTLRPTIGHGYRHGALRMPIVLQTHNFASNGLVMRAPTRMELIVPPPAAMTPEPWLEQLTTHELRHAVQYNNVDRHFIRGLSWLLGDQGSLVGVGLFPIWALEGDAVMAETELATFGRGLQPSFTIDYRAMVGGKRHRYAPDKWFAGSYKDHMPDHYALGYQLATYAYTKYGENVWDKVADYSARRPYVILTARAALWKYYRTSVKRLLRETLADLDTYWSSLPPVEPTGRIIPTPLTSFTTYSSPLAIDGRIVAIKKDLDRVERLVVVEGGRERTLFEMGAPNSPLAYDPPSGRLYWSELRRSKFWGQKINSQLVYADLDGSKPRAMKGYRQLLFPTPTGDGRMAYIHYAYDGTYSIRILGREEPLASFPPPVSLHGLAYEGGTFYLLVVDRQGMGIDRLTDGRIETLKPRGYATLSDLRAADGVLYFTSTWSGRDEAHAIVLGRGQEVQLSVSQYGSFFPTHFGDSILATTYTPDGYLLSKHPGEAFRVLDPATLNPMPRNVVNPPRKHWELPPPADPPPLPDTATLKIERYRKLPHAIHIHSWAPVAFDPGSVAGESSPDVQAGVTLIAQNPLSTTMLSARWALQDGHSLVDVGVEYGGLPVKFSLSSRIGGGRQRIYAPSKAQLPGLTDHFEIETRTYLPIRLDAGARIRLLQPSATYQYYNALLFSDTINYTRGVHKLVGELYWGDNVRMAHRDFLPRLGYALSATLAANPFSDRFGTLWSLWARAYLPGVAPHHSLTLRAALQGQSAGEGKLHFLQKLLYPKGADYDISPKRYLAGAIDYQLPVAYPDWGLTSFLYIKRIRLNLAGYWARYRSFAADAPRQQRWSYGGDLTFDVNILRTPAAATNTLSLSVYKPSDRKGLFVGFGFTLPI